MGLIGNHSVLTKHPGRDFGGGSIGLGMDRSSFGKPSPARAWFAEPVREPKEGIPAGLPPGYTWVIPLSAGTMSSRNVISGSGTLAANLASGINLVAPLTGSGSLAGDLALITSLAAGLTGSGSLAASLQAIATLAAGLAGSGAISAASLSVLANISAALAGSGAATANLTGLLYMSADITPFTTLSPENLAAAVWNAIAADFNVVGSMGEKVNDAGSASNPWTEVIEGSFTAAEMLRLIAAAAAGELSGAGTTTITILGIDETTDRIIATVDGTGNRTATVLDGA